MKFINTLITICSLAYGLFVVLWFAAYLIVPDQWWPLIILNKLAFFFLVASIPVFVVALLSRIPRAIGATLLPVLVFGYFYSPFLMPKKTDLTEAPEFRVMTYNIWNQNKNISAVLKVIDAAKPDIVAVQELMDDIQEELQERMAVNYPYYYISPEIYGGTTALFSKHELINVQTIDFNIDRPAIAADVVLGDTLLRVIGAHLYPSYYSYHDRPVAEMPEAIEQYIVDQQAQIHRLVEVIRSSNDIPIVLACDCNVQRTSSSRLLLEEVLTDSAVEMGWQMSQAPIGANFERDINHIDYIWYAGAIKPKGLYRSIESGGSDHAPVFADFFTN